MVLWPYEPPTPLNGSNMGGHYLYGLSGCRADSVWVDGETILEGGKFKKLDYEGVLSECAKLAKALWERI